MDWSQSSTLKNQIGGKSLPILEAWIEVRFNRKSRGRRTGRFLYWKRGLKYEFGLNSNRKKLSLPILEAWIEVTILAEQILTVNSRFLYWKRGLKYLRNRHQHPPPRPCRFLYWKRGLKFSSCAHPSSCTLVASYTGSVDWSLQALLIVLSSALSLPILEAWIEVNLFMQI